MDGCLDGHKNSCIVLIDYFPPSTQLGSGIASTALQCGTRQCPTNTMVLDKPVIIIIKHSEEVQVSGDMLMPFLDEFSVL